MDEKRKAELRGLCERATAGEWCLAGDRTINALPGFYPILIANTARGVRGADDANFIAAARTAIPELLDDNDRLEIENATLEAVNIGLAQQILELKGEHDNG